VLEIINIDNLWLFYVIGYAIALIFQFWANRKRGESFDDPEFLFKDKKIVTIAMIWLFGGFVISIFVPINYGFQFYLGLIFCIIGLIVVLATLYNFAQNSGLVIKGINRYSRNPGYVGWLIFYLGLTIMGWSLTIWSILFFVYFLITIPYFHWTVLLEEKFLLNKYGDGYKEYLIKTPRYLGKSKKEN
jgi:protein-S-isoprenylcysteine O-methyltransferase Ste14